MAPSAFATAWRLRVVQWPSMEQDIILKTDRAGRVRMPRERQEQIVSEWKVSGLSAMRFAATIVSVKRGTSCAAL